MQDGALAARELRAHGYTVIEAADGVEGERVGLTYPGDIHLLLTDVVMPGQSGYKLSQALCRARPKMKALFMSGYTDDAITEAGDGGRGGTTLHKCLTAPVLAQRVREIIIA